MLMILEPARTTRTTASSISLQHRLPEAQTFFKGPALLEGSKRSDFSIPGSSLSLKSPREEKQALLLGGFSPKKKAGLSKPLSLSVSSSLSPSPKLWFHTHTLTRTSSGYGCGTNAFSRREEEEEILQRKGGLGFRTLYADGCCWGML